MSAKIVFIINDKGYSKGLGSFKMFWLFQSSTTLKCIFFLEYFCAIPEDNFLLTDLLKNNN